jgi:hypothetical protein
MRNTALKRFTPRDPTARPHKQNNNLISSEIDSELLSGSFFAPKTKELININTQYIYPANLKAAANLWLWSLKSVCVIGVCALLSVLALAQLKTVLPLGFTAGFAFLTIRMDDLTILDFLRNATRFFISTQQHYEWKEQTP